MSERVIQWVKLYISSTKNPNTLLPHLAGFLLHAEINNWPILNLESRGDTGKTAYNRSYHFNIKSSFSFRWQLLFYMCNLVNTNINWHCKKKLHYNNATYICFLVNGIKWTNIHNVEWDPAAKHIALGSNSLRSQVLCLMPLFYHWIKLVVRRIYIYIYKYIYERENTDMIVTRAKILSTR